MSDSDVTQFDEERAAGYDERIRRLVPGYETLHEAIASVLSTELGDEARLLVVGAGTGFEVEMLSHVRPGWRFTAVDPSSEMLERCERRMDAVGIAERVDLVCAPIQEVSVDERFDAATSIFVAHFIDQMSAKRRYFEAIADRLAPDAPLVVADLYDSSPGEGSEMLMAAWKEAFQRAGATAEDADASFARIRRQISFVDQPTLAGLLEEVGFEELVRVFQSFRWGAWWARKSNG